MTRMHGEPPLWLLVIGVLGLVFFMSQFNADKHDAVRTAVELGYTDVRIVDESSFLTDCGKHSTRYELVARDSHEHEVHLIACCLSDCTVRLKH
ncbi:MAG: hypothetical protein Q7R80_02380 [bacterium]|nr:hypothetical protein [bacterium]